ncbi:MAG TPA: FAD/NAD(P)-binding oxidoreductase [Planctomycetaceae bacterium]|nr:FAD/NAD(P)-binding oxidoreductase [Planctomycetaceae bacterium]
MIAPTSQLHIVIVGGGTAGITVAAQLTRKLKRARVTILDPATKHYYQPLWTLVGAGVFRKEVTEKDEARVIPKHARWVQEAVAEFRPEQNLIVTRGGAQIGYDYLVVAPGIQINWNQVKGLPEALGTHGICSNYSYQTVDSTWDAIRNFRGGNAIFTMPNTAVKCGGAPQKIMYLAEDYFRRSDVRERTHIIFASAGGQIFSVPKYRTTLEAVIRRKEIDTRFKHNLIEVRAEQQEAVFERLDTHEKVVLPFDLLHVTPPMGPPDFIRTGPLANKDGWVEVDKFTLQHPRYANIFSLGDASGLPTSKTGAAIRKQAPVVVQNLIAASRGEPLPAKYEGYTSCPVVTGYGSLVLAEFDYDMNPQETFPFDQSKERYSMYLLKKYLLPAMYWQGMLKGRM